MVKRFLIVGLCSILILETFFPEIDLGDLANLTELTTHYRKHRIESPDISFFNFLCLHYSDAGHLASAPLDHQDLPFSKGHHHRINLQITQELTLISIQTPFFGVLQLDGVTNPVIHTHSISAQVWQPPRA